MTGFDRSEPMPELSECCGAQPLHDVSGAVGLCSQCKEWATFKAEPQTDKLAELFDAAEMAAQRLEGLGPSGFGNALPPAVAQRNGEIAGSLRAAVAKAKGVSP